jgi:hypothetical protein
MVVVVVIVEVVVAVVGVIVVVVGMLLVVVPMLLLERKEDRVVFSLDFKVFAFKQCEYLCL